MEWKDMVLLLGKSLGLSLLVYLMGYVGFSFSWIIIAIGIWVAGECVKQDKQALFSSRKETVIDEKKAILARIEDLPAWVSFPDVERAEWLNKMIRSLWPYVGDYVRDYIREKVEPALIKSISKHNKIGAFKFVDIDLGDLPLKIGGIKVHSDTCSRHEIILDLDLFYSGDCRFQVSIGKVKAGIKDIQFHGNLRAVLKPLTKKIPLIGGVQVFLLNRPTIDFNLTDTANVFDVIGINNILRGVVTDTVCGIIGLPNKFSMKLISDIPTKMLNYPEPKGVIRIKVNEAADLKKMDMAFGKSDPYARITVGSVVFQTKTISNTLNPQWNFVCEAIIFHISGVSVHVDVVDEDQGTEDDDMGRVSLDVETVAKKGKIDNWFALENVDTGKVHLEAQWFNLSSDLLQLTSYNQSNTKSQGISTCVLIVYVDSAKELPITSKTGGEPSPYVRCHVGNSSQETHVCRNTNNPIWEKGLTFFISDPEIEELSLEIKVDQKPEASLGKLTYQLRKLLTENNLEVNAAFKLKEAAHNSTIQLCLQLLVMSTGSTTVQPVPDVPTVSSGLPTNIQPDTCENNVFEETPIIPSPPVKTLDAAVDSAGDNALRRRRANSVDEENKCSIHITMRHSNQKQVLIVVVHRVKNLPCAIPSDLPDPYVKLQLIPDIKEGRRKTSTIKNCCNPTFDETFEFPMASSDLSKYMLQLVVCFKTSGFFAKKKRFGKINIALSDHELSSATSKWFDVESLADLDDDY